jgi:uncharacterized repeat protein (TIGR01451 family)
MRQSKRSRIESRLLNPVQRAAITERPLLPRSLWRLLVFAIFGWIGTALAQTSFPPPLSWPDLDLRVAGRIFAVAHQPDGGVVFGGMFSSVNGVPRINLARLLPNGELDPDWAPRLIGSVHALASDDSGAVYVGGDFTQVSGLNRGFIAKLAGSGVGAVDPAWAPGFSSFVDAIAVGPAGDVYVGGNFLSANSLPRRSLAKVSGNGVVDPLWNPGAPGTVQALVLDEHGDLYVAGTFQTLGGVPRIGIGRVSGGGAGEFDPTWNPGVNGAVHALALDHGGSLFAGGSFTAIGGQSRSRLAKLTTSGEGNAVVDWSPAVDGPVLALSLDDVGYLHAGGRFDTADGAARRNLARFETTGGGQVDLHWSPQPNGEVLALAHRSEIGLIVGGEFSTLASQLRTGLTVLDPSGVPRPALSDAELEGEIFAMVTQPDGGLIVGGNFVRANGIERRGMLRFTSDGVLDPIWNPARDGHVNSLAAYGPDVVFAGGSFPSADGGPSRHVLKLEGQGAGAVDETWTPMPDGEVDHVVLDAKGNLYIAGSFVQVSGIARSRLAKLDGSGAGAVLAWDPDPDARINAIAIDGDSHVIVAGAFTSFRGVPRAGIARLSAQGAGLLDELWGPGPVEGIEALEVGGGDSLFIGGKFNVVGGVERYALAKLSRQTGLVDPLWHPGVSGYVAAIEADGRGNLFVGGYFTWIDFVDQPNLAKVSVHDLGRVDPYWAPDISGVVSTLAAGSPGIVHAAGQLFFVDNESRKNLVAFPTAYTLTYSGSSTGGIEGEAFQSVLHGGDGQPVTATPVFGYRFAGWSDGSVENPRTDQAVTAAVDVVANFVVRDDVADLQITKENAPGPLVDDEPTVYAVVVSNAGPNAVSALRVRDLLPATLINGSWRCVAAASTAACPVPGAGDGDLDAMVALGVADTVRFDVTVTVSAEGAAFVSNTATVAAMDATVELSPSDNAATDTDPVLSRDIHRSGFESALPRD